MLKSWNRCLGVISLVSCMLLASCGKDSTNSESNTSVVSSVSQQELNSDNQDSSDVRSSDSAGTSDIQPNDAQTDGGGNEYNSSSESEIARFDILVSEDKYFYNNSPIELVDFISELNEYEGDLIIVISDDNATLQAYKALTEKLDEYGISYEDAK